jgi:hypothetical protein
VAAIPLLSLSIIRSRSLPFDQRFSQDSIRNDLVIDSSPLLALSSRASMHRASILPFFFFKRTQMSFELLLKRTKILLFDVSK